MIKDEDLAFRDVSFFKPKLDKLVVSFKWPKDSRITSAHLYEVHDEIIIVDNPIAVKTRPNVIPERDSCVSLEPIAIGLKPTKYKLIPVIDKGGGAVECFFENGTLSGGTYQYVDSSISFAPLIAYTKLRQKRCALKKIYEVQIHMPIALRESLEPSFDYYINDIKYSFDMGIENYQIVVDKKDSLTVDI